MNHFKMIFCMGVKIVNNIHIKTELSGVATKQGFYVEIVAP